MYIGLHGSGDTLMMPGGMKCFKDQRRMCRKVKYGKYVYLPLQFFPSNLDILVIHCQNLDLSPRTMVGANRERQSWVG